MSFFHIATYCNRIGFQFGVQHTFDRSIKIVHIAMQYLGLEIEFESIVEDDETITAFIANGSRSQTEMPRIAYCFSALRRVYEILKKGKSNLRSVH